MKVLQVLNTTFPYQVGGAEVSAREVRLGLRKLGYDIDVVTLRTSQTKQIKNVESLDTNTIYLDLFNVYDPWRDKTTRSTISKVTWKIIDWFNPASFIHFLKLLRKNSYDAMLCHNIKGFSVSIWLAAFILRVKVVQVLHDYYLICSTCALGDIKRGRCPKQCSSCYIYSLPKKVLSSKVSCFIGVSEFVVNRHQKDLGFPNSKKQVIYNVREPLKAIRNRIFSDETLVIGFIGRIEKSKGIEEFLLSCSQCKTPIRCVVAGSESHNGYIKSLIHRFQSIKISWIGHVESSTFYESVDIVVVSSIWDEPFPAVAYEPQMHGNIVIANRVGGIPEIVLDGETGFLCNPNHPLEISAIIDKLNLDRDLMRKISSRAKQESHRFTNQTNLVTKYHNILSQL